LLVASFPAATPVTTRTLSSSSLSATISWISALDVVAPAATVPEIVVSVTLGAALFETVIV